MKRLLAVAAIAVGLLLSNVAGSAQAAGIQTSDIAAGTSGWFISTSTQCTERKSAHIFMMNS